VFATNLTRSLYRQFLSDYQSQKAIGKNDETVEVPDNAWVYVDHRQIKYIGGPVAMAQSETGHIVDDDFAVDIVMTT